MKVLHITNWFPTISNPFGALWVKRHIESLPESVENKIYHIEIKKGRIGFQSTSVMSGQKSYILSLPIQIWKINEILYFLILTYVRLIKEGRSSFDIVNIHIAYPLLRYYNRIPLLKKNPIVITEHWSAYHYHFNLLGSDKLRPIKQIFNHQLPVITVSKSLGNDIKRFSEGVFENFVLPNVVDTNLFFPEKSESIRKSYFLMVSQWKAPKSPLIAINGFVKLSQIYPEIQLIIIGYGEQMEGMKSAAEKNERIKFLGPKSAGEIADYMRSAIALVHPSEYETFSVVCAEALACGCPVIASNVGGIPEFVNDGNGILLAQNTENEILEAMQRMISAPPEMINIPDFSSKTVGYQYLNILEKIKNGIT